MSKCKQLGTMSGSELFPKMEVETLRQLRGTHPASPWFWEGEPLVLGASLHSLPDVPHH